MDQQSHLRPDDGEALVLFDQLLLRLRDAVATVIYRIHQRVIQAFVVLSLVTLLLFLAAFLYGSFYYAYMPRAAFSTPLHYHYRTDCDSPAPLCSYPVANISLLRNRKHVLTFGQTYRISLHLEMPESPTNEDLGMFMIKATCFSQKDVQLASSVRSAQQPLPASVSRFSMLRYRSDLLKTLTTVLFLPAFLAGTSEQKQQLEVELFSNYVDDPYSPSVTAVIEILSHKVQIYSSQLYVHAHFTGIRYLLFYFPVVSALVGVASNFIFLSVLFVVSYMRLLLRFEWRPEQVRNNGPVSAREQPEDDKGAAEQVGPLRISTATPEETVATAETNNK
ncbi:seipin-like isoform X2 [Betta splendens]|uniref:Seipin n=1 Tax=Betta splendens TaxID=158456 RepID=A0A9W2Y2S3_BETSP|nr:seipin-like isoform X2 [Betta splendens]